MSQYTLKNILLKESNFKLNDNVILPPNAQLHNDESIKVQSVKQNDALCTFVEVTLIIRSEQQNIIESKVVMVGIFEPSDWNDQRLHEFCKINAPAIVFPFLREHIANLTAKAGLPVYLSPVNFVELAKQQP